MKEGVQTEKGKAEKPLQGVVFVCNYSAEHCSRGMQLKTHPAKDKKNTTKSTF